jgi:hypothetical protein
MWHNDTVVEESNLYEMPKFFFPLYFTPEEPRVVFGQQYGSIGEGNNRFSEPMFTFPVILNEDIPAAVFGELSSSTYNIINYDGVLSTGIVFRIISTGTIRNLTIQMEHGDTVQMFTLTGEYPANTEIIIDTREGFNTVTVGGIDRTEDVDEGSEWFRLRPGMNIFTFFFNSDGQLNVFIEVNQSSLFEVQT